MHTKAIWVQERDARGRMFHRAQEFDASKGLWGALPGTWLGLDLGIGVAPLRFATDLRDGERPTFRHVNTVCAVEHGAPGSGCYVKLTKAQYPVCDTAAAMRRHGPDERCTRCGGPRGDHHWTVDARTVAEPVYCAECLHWFELACLDEQTLYQEMDCACGAWCYRQVQPKPTERGERNDVMPCPTCKQPRCEACLPDGARACVECVEKRKAA